MRKIYIIAAVILIIFGLILTILPIEKLALLPIVLGLILSLLALSKSEIDQKYFPKFILIFAIILLIVALGKIFLIKDEIKINRIDEIQKIESQKEDKKDLEELDGL